MRSLIPAIISAATVLSVSACSDATPVDVTQVDLDPQLQASAMAPGLQAGPMVSSVHWLSDLSEVEGAVAQLTRTESGVSYSFRTNELEKGHVVTIWWVIFNDPDECANPDPRIAADCGLPDLSNPDVQASVMGGDGHIVGNSGKSTHAGHLSEGEITNYHPAFEGSPGLLDAMGAEIHLVLRTHGPMIPKMISEMRDTFEAACTPESSAGFGEGPNTCADLQAAAFPAP